MGKKRPPRKQLLEAGKIARQTLEERKIILESDKSAIDKITNTPGAPILPGLIKYIPYPWTIHAARRIVYDLGRAWQKEIKDTDSKKMLGVEFFKFVIEGLNRPKSDLHSAMVKTIKDKRYNQKFLSRNETIDAMKRFLIDSFAIAVIVKAHTDVADYLEWFLHWTDSLLKLWPDNIQDIDKKIIIGNSSSAKRENV